MAELAYLQLTRRCNQVCRFCSNPSNGRVLDTARARAWLERFRRKGYHGVILTGGEPTLHPELPELVRHACSLGLPARLITNAQKTSDPDYLKRLRDAGLEHMHVSVYSLKAEVQGFLTGKPDSLRHIERTLDHAGRLGIRVDINTVINRYNAGHLASIVRGLTQRWPYLRHFVWNNLDPLMNRASDNLDTVPKLRDFELELWLAMRHLDASGRSFRAERVPLCFMTEFAHCSTETRKIVKEEGRAVFFLDSKGLSVQNRRFWSYGQSPRCGPCSLRTVCAGLYQMDRYYSSEELCPVFVPLEPVVRRILGSEPASPSPGGRR